MMKEVVAETPLVGKGDGEELVGEELRKSGTECAHECKRVSSVHVVEQKTTEAESQGDSEQILLECRFDTLFTLPLPPSGLPLPRELWVQRQGYGSEHGRWSHAVFS